MTERVNDGVEILVHTTAPSRGKDDARYRALTSAYLLFEPVKRLSLGGDFGNEDTSALGGKWDRQPCAGCQNSLSDDIAPQSVTAAVIDDEDRSFDLSQVESEVSALENQHGRSRAVENDLIESPQLSFHSVLDNLGSPLLRRAEGRLRTPLSKMKRIAPSPTPEDESSWSTPPSVIPDSQPPIRRTSQEFSSPARALELYLRHFNRSGSQEAPDSMTGGSQRGSPPGIDYAASSDKPRHSFIHLITPVSSLAAHEVVQETPPVAQKQLPNLPEPKKKIPLATLKANHLSKVKLIPGHTKFRQHESAPPKPVPQSLKPPARSTPHASQAPKRRRLSTTSAAEAIFSTPIKTWTPSPPSVFQGNEIHPPLPSTGTNGNLPPRLTPSLRAICGSLPPTNLYRPLSQTRSLRHEERGYWSVSMLEWEQALRDKVWNGLKSFIGKGMAGWGVWCLRCGGGGGDATVADSWDGDETQKGDWAELRVYCWGEVTKEIWLMLYVVSEKKIRGRGARWVDGGGEAVVVMS